VAQKGGTRCEGKRRKTVEQGCAKMGGAPFSSWIEGPVDFALRIDWRLTSVGCALRAQYLRMM
jgi:hypothetical protein